MPGKVGGAFDDSGEVVENTEYANLGYRADYRIEAKVVRENDEEIR